MLQKIRKLIGWYFFLGAIAAFIFYLMIIGTSAFFLYLLPNMIAVAVFSFYVVSAWIYIKNPKSGTRTNIFLFSLILQGLQIELGGFVFKNFFGPEISFRLVLNDFERSGLVFKNFHQIIMNGYFGDNFAKQIQINFVYLLIIAIVVWPENKKV